jgi:hypothetical protein
MILAWNGAALKAGDLWTQFRTLLATLLTPSRDDLAGPRLLKPPAADPARAMPLCERSKEPTVQEMYGVLLPFHPDLTVEALRTPDSFKGYKQEYWERQGGRCEVQASHRRLSTGAWVCWEHGGKDGHSDNDIVSQPDYKKIKDPRSRIKEAAANAPAASAAVPAPPQPPAPAPAPAPIPSGLRIRSSISVEPPMSPADRDGKG